MGGIRRDVHLRLRGADKWEDQKATHGHSIRLQHSVPDRMGRTDCDISSDIRRYFLVVNNKDTADAAMEQKEQTKGVK